MISVVIIMEEKKPIEISLDNPSIARIKERCIKCGRCRYICNEVVGIPSDNHVCVNCGQCLLNCPTGAIVTKYNYKKVLDYINDTDKCVVCHVAPSVRTSLGEAFGMDAGVNVEGKIVTALKKLGFDYVFDTTFGADLTIEEESHEFIERLKNKKRLPQFTSCCPAWVKYLEHFHPKLINNLSTCKSPIGMQNSIIKTYFSEMEEIDRENIITVSIAPCTAKKAECAREELVDGDFSLTTVELSLMIKEAGIDFVNLKDTPFDDLMSRGSSGGVIFGTSGGVSESLLRTSYYIMTGKSPKKSLLDFKKVRGYDNLKEATVKIGDEDIRLLVSHGLKNIEPILCDIEKGIVNYDLIEVMNCPLGCVGGGGQILGAVSKQEEINTKRSMGLYQENEKLECKFSSANPNICEVYKSFLGNHLEGKAEEILHTKFSNKSKVLKEDNSFDINKNNSSRKKEEIWN